MIELRVTDLKQYLYCPRVVYYQYVLPVEKRATYKMEHGKSAQVRLERLEGRRKLARYGLAGGRRHFGPYLQSRRLGLSGKMDLMIETEAACFPVDFKFTTGRPHRNHRYQLGGYALLIEEAYGKAVETGFVYLIPKDDAVVCPLGPELKADCLRVLAEIRAMIEGERMPGPNVSRNRCTDCEYQNYCRDIW